jgi:hypothetical protein
MRHAVCTILPHKEEHMSSANVFYIIGVVVVIALVLAWLF